ncbi:IclR family transcriptional regulator C-terminal domain-containing protein [Terricaulis sp.]|uniref:IclR family transcriptional regulator domain-containing protein n=1 Tax=Terricaulis sp. TaxID=2768686 RepID=UPI003783C8CB
MVIAHDNDDSHIQSLARGLAVLTAFRPGAERLTMAQVASACGLTRAGARRILLTLQNLGYVDVEDRHFFLTSKVLDLGQGFLGQSIWERARPVLQDVVDRLNETASAGVLEGFDVVYTLRVRSSRVLHLELHPGMHMPAHASSIGRVLLAALPQHQLAAYLRQATFKRYTAATVADPEVLRQRLDEVRTRGWCHVHGEIDEGVSGVAVPLIDRDGVTRAALSIGATLDRATPEAVRQTIVPTLHEAAAKIGALL